MQRVVVVGGGIMGNGIAQVVATSGLDVTLVDVSEAALEKAQGADREVARRGRSRSERLTAGGRRRDVRADVVRRPTSAWRPRPTT